ncbi:MAG TPA: hypothetical protein VG104_11875 [Candidatus Dormibacteraeota bacterium]|nr:hypothetical protein [Candidatus Dormibacteraeota bacterium]
MSRPDPFVAVDFAPPRPIGIPRLRIAAAAAAVVVLIVVVLGVTQLLLR